MKRPNYLVLSGEDSIVSLMNICLLQDANKIPMSKLSDIFFKI